MKEENLFQTDLFGAEEKPKKKKISKKESAPVSADFAEFSKNSKKETSTKREPLAPRKTNVECSVISWKEKFLEFEITVPSQKIKDTIKESLLTEGLGKREANKFFTGLFFKEKVFNTKTQAEEYLKTMETTYAVKYKIGIEPSPKMISLKERRDEKKAKLKAYVKEQNAKFSAAFITCPHCKSKLNCSYLTPPECPVCHEDLRSATAVKRIHDMENTIQELSKRYENESRKYNSKFTGGERWILRLVNPLEK